MIGKRITAGALCLAAMAAFCGVRPAARAGAGELPGGGEPYAVRTVLREYTAADPETRTAFYGRYTQLVPEDGAPETLRSAAAACSRRAEEAVMARAKRAESERAPRGPVTDGYRTLTYGYIASVTRADGAAFSILETEFEKGIGQSESEISYRFRGAAYDSRTGEEISLSSLIGGGSPDAMLRCALRAKYGTDEPADAGEPCCAWAADALGIRFFFASDALSLEKRREIDGYAPRPLTVAFRYGELSGEKAEELAAAAPESYIAMIERDTRYDLPHAGLSVLITQSDGSTVLRASQAGGAEKELAIEYADSQSDFYFIRTAGGNYLFRQRTAYQEGFFYDFSRPDGGFGRFAYNPCQYFDSFLREIRLALPYDPYCAHMAEVRRSFGESLYGAGSFVPHGHYSFPGDPAARYKRFVLTDASLSIDAYGCACRLLADFSAQRADGEGGPNDAVTVPAGSALVFTSCDGEASRYDDPPRRSYARTFTYGCLLPDGRRVRFESGTESSVSSDAGFLSRFTRPVTLAEALFEKAAVEPAPFTVRIAGADYPLIPDWSLPSHTGEEIDFGGAEWWTVEGYPGLYAATDADMEEMRGNLYSQNALSGSEDRPALRIGGDGSVVFECGGTAYTGILPQKRLYRTAPDVLLTSSGESRSFRIVLREGEAHSRPERIELFSEGEPATNEPSRVPPLSVYLTRVPE